MITKELQVQASYASQMERDVKRTSDSGGGRGTGRDQTPQYQKGGRGGGSQAQSQSPQSQRFFSRGAGAQGSSAAPAGRGSHSEARGNHMRGEDGAQYNGMEPMRWQRQDGGSRGGRGGRGRASSAPPVGRGRSSNFEASPRTSFGNPPGSPQGRGDRNGAANNERFGTRQPINDPRNESATALPKGPYWHECGDGLRCASAMCGQDTTVFCQGCAWHGHSREWCYKGAEQGFNPTGYWSVNRRGQAPLPGKNGEFRGGAGRMNHIDAEQGGDRAKGNGSA